MEKKKIAMIFPYTPAYREPIYREMEKAFNVDWFFCENASLPLKMMDYSILKRCDLSMKEEKILGPLHKYKGIDKLKLDGYDAIIAAPVIRCVSMWRLASHYGHRKNGPKFYFWGHGWYGKETSLECFLKKQFLSKADGCFVYNNRAKNLMLKLGFKESSLHVIYNSLDYDVQLKLRNSLQATNLYNNHFNNDNKNIVFIGRLTKVKRFDLLLDALYILKIQGQIINVTFVGDGVERQNMERMVEEKGLKEQVWFYGACYDERINAELIYNADLCVSPGNIGLTAMHVLMFGCPAITNDDFNYQMPEFEAIHVGQTGDFFKVGDSQSLAVTISNWFRTHQNDREQVRKACYEEIDTKWNPHKQIEVLEEALEK